MEKCLQPRAHHCRQIFVKIRHYWFFRLFLRVLTSNVTICRFLVVKSRLKGRQSSMIFQGDMITYMSQGYVKFTHFFCRRLILSLSSLRTCNIDRCEPRYAGTEFTNRVCEPMQDVAALQRQGWLINAMCVSLKSLLWSCNSGVLSSWLVSNISLLWRYILLVFCLLQYHQL